jgi:hypothetical protein
MSPISLFNVLASKNLIHPRPAGPGTGY